MGYILHPSITLPSSPRIADIATGTARFLVRIHSSVPDDAKLEGFDISSDLFPPKSELPSNITLGIGDAKQPFPEEMYGKYDLVHVRLLVAAMNPEDWDVTVRNLVPLLKPGGYLQWEECEFINGVHKNDNPGGRFETTKYMCDFLAAALHDRFQHGWNTLPGIMREAKLDPVLTDVASSARVPEARAAMTTAIVNLTFTWAQQRAKAGTPIEFPGKMTSLDEVEKAVHDEIQSGCYFDFNIHIACGRKPVA
ncbi:hypothetical protein F5Y15DRAFT_384 [Xylariaceae sp. FL0016]|nr:hypothetical protein F5Y15DRAFT_384 [Xylariaceae sp. FL0016]